MQYVNNLIESDDYEDMNIYLNDDMNWSDEGSDDDNAIFCLSLFYYTL